MVNNIMAALEYMEKKKLTQNDAQVVERIIWKQKDIARRLVPVFIRCDEFGAEEVSRIRHQLVDWGIYPYKPFAGGMKHAFYDTLFRFPRLLNVTRTIVLKN